MGMRWTAVDAGTADQIVVRSDDRTVSVVLRPTQYGLWVRRERLCCDTHARLVQSAVFRDQLAFARWCDTDSLRFDHPMVSSAVKREGGALLEIHARSDTSDPAS